MVVAFAIVYNIPRFLEHQPIVRKSSNFDQSSLINDQHHEQPTNDLGANVTSEWMNLGDLKLYQIIYSNVLYYPVMYIVPLVSLFFLNGRLIKALKEIKARKELLTGHRAR